MENNLFKVLFVFGAMIFGISFAINIVTYVNRKKDADDVSTESNLNSSLSQSEQVGLRFDHDNSFRSFDEDYEGEDDIDEEDGTVSVKVAIFNGSAYWLTDEGKFNTAPVDEDEEVIYSLAEPVDTMDMDQDELEVLMEIVDALKKEE